MVGSAIGGLSGGWRGEREGTLIGMAAGAIAGAAVGNANEKQRREEIEGYHRRMEEKQSRRESARRSKRRTSSDVYANRGGADDVYVGSSKARVADSQSNEVYVDETNSGDDRIDFTPGNGYPSETDPTTTAGTGIQSDIYGSNSSQEKTVSLSELENIVNNK